MRGKSKVVRHRSLSSASCSLVMWVTEKRVRHDATISRARGSPSRKATSSLSSGFLLSKIGGSFHGSARSAALDEGSGTQINGRNLSRFASWFAGDEVESCVDPTWDRSGVNSPTLPHS